MIKVMMRIMIKNRMIIIMKGMMRTMMNNFMIFYENYILYLKVSQLENCDLQAGVSVFQVTPEQN